MNIIMTFVKFDFKQKNVKKITKNYHENIYIE